MGRLAGKGIQRPQPKSGENRDQNLDLSKICMKARVTKLAVTFCFLQDKICPVSHRSLRIELGELRNNWEMQSEKSANQNWNTKRCNRASQIEIDRERRNHNLRPGDRSGPALGSRSVRVDDG